MSNSGNKFKKSFTNARFTSGAYSTVISVIVIAVVVVLNMAFNNLDLSFDLTSEEIYSLTDESKAVLKDVDTPVTVYYLVTENGANERIKKSLDSFKDVNPNIKIEEKDPVLYPAFGEQFDIEDSLANNDVIVVNDKTNTAKYISNSSMYFSAYSSDMSLTGETLDVEGCVVSAIQYVIDGKKNNMYCLLGHDESIPGDEIFNAVEKLNTDWIQLNLSTKGEIPDDCDVLYIGAPKSDLKEDEKDLIIDYLKAGGDAIILTGNTYAEYSDQKMDNFNEVLEYLGIEIDNGQIYEDAGHYYQTQSCIVPEINDSSAVMDSISKDSIMILSVESMKLADSSDLRSTLTVTPLLTTSDKSFLRKNVKNTDSKKQSEDVDGPFTVGAFFEDKVDADNTSKVVVYSSYYFVLDNSSAGIYSPSPENYKLFTNAFSSVLESEVDVVSVPKKSLEDVQVIVPVGTQVFLAVIIIILIPGTLLLMGFVLWFFRRKK
ncbi:MAG: GldG family protein [Lachnospiraceae bacterium]|nr:GldG family protein [Lachnospiraceae bacterium]